MKYNKIVNDEDLNNVTGGSDLDKYLKSIERKDKNKILVDYESGTTIEHDSDVDYDKSGNLIIIKREKNNREKNNEEQIKN